MKNLTSDERHNEINGILLHAIVTPSHDWTQKFYALFNAVINFIKNVGAKLFEFYKKIFSAVKAYVIFTLSRDSKPISKNTLLFEPESWLDMLEKYGKLNGKLSMINRLPDGIFDSKYNDRLSSLITDVDVLCKVVQSAW